MKHEPRPAIHMEKQHGRLVSWVGQSLWGPTRWFSVSQVDGVSDMAPACQICGRRV